MCRQMLREGAKGHAQWKAHRATERCVLLALRTVEHLLRIQPTFHALYYNAAFNSLPTIAPFEDELMATRNAGMLPSVMSK